MPQSANLESVPELIVYHISKQILSWAEQPGREGWMSKEKMEEQRRLRDSTLLSLVLASKSTQTTWLPHLLSNMTLDYTNLASFLLLVKRNGNSGRFVKSLTLLDLPGSVELGNDRSVDERTHASIAFEAARSCSDVEHSSLQDVGTFPNLRDLVPNQDTKYKAFTFLDHVRRVILTSLPNLTTLVIKGNVSWSLDPQFQEDVALSSLQNLKSIDFGPSRANVFPKINGKNALWMLLFLPSLRRASFNIQIHKSDLKFFKSHSDAYAGKSSVKELFINFHFNYDPDQEEKLNWEGDSKVVAVKNFLLATKDLTQAEVSVSAKTSLMFKVPLKFGQMNWLWALEGLEKSHSTLRYLKFDGLGAFPEKDKEPRFDFSRFLSLERLDFQAHVCVLLAISSKASPFPASLTTIRFATAANNGPFSLEGVLARELKRNSLLFPGGLRKIITPSFPMRDVGAPIVMPVEKWEAGMEDLKKACEELDIKLHLLHSEKEASFEGAEYALARASYAARL